MEEPAAERPDPLFTSPRRSVRLAKRNQQSHTRERDEGHHGDLPQPSAPGEKHSKKGCPRSLAEKEALPVPQREREGGLMQAQRTEEGYAHDGNEDDEEERQVLQKLRVVELRAMLRALGLGTAGRKKKLVDSLLDARRRRHEGEGTYDKDADTEGTATHPCPGGGTEREEQDEAEGYRQREESEVHPSVSESSSSSAGGATEADGQRPLATQANEAFDPRSTYHSNRRHEEDSTDFGEAEIPHVVGEALLEMSAYEQQRRTEEEEKREEGGNRSIGRRKALKQGQAPAERRRLGGGGGSLLLLLLLLLLAAAVAAWAGDGRGEGMPMLVALMLAGVAGIGVGMGVLVLGPGLAAYLRRRRARGQIKVAIAHLEANHRTLRGFLSRLDDERELVKLQLEELYSSPTAAASSSSASQERTAAMKRLSTKLARLSSLRDQKCATMRDLKRQLARLSSLGEE